MPVLSSKHVGIEMNVGDLVNLRKRSNRPVLIVKVYPHLYRGERYYEILLDGRVATVRGFQLRGNNESR